MPRLILHTGIHKTGTTSLQKAFFDNRRHLRRNGVLYPKTGLSQKPGNWGHHELAYAMRGPGTAHKLLSALREEADASDVETIFVSSEELSLLPFPGLPGVAPYHIIREYFDGFDIRILCYLRPQADMVASLYNHHVKSAGETGDIMQFIARIAPRLEYLHYLHVAAVALECEEAIWVHRYGPTWMENDIVSDVTERIDVPLWRGFDRRVYSLNPGLTHLGLDEMLAANRRHADDTTALLAARKHILSVHRASPYETYQPLGDEARATIEALYSSKNRQIGRRFMSLDGDLFDPETKALPEFN